MGDLTIQQIEQALINVREFILSDGGDLKIVDVKNHQVFIKLEGACVSCPFSIYTVQMGIVKTLKEQLLDDIEVVLVNY